MSHTTPISAPSSSLVATQYYGITEERFYTVLFGVSRALGVLSQARSARGQQGALAGVPAGGQQLHVKQTAPRTHFAVC